MEEIAEQEEVLETPKADKVEAAVRRKMKIFDDILKTSVTSPEKRLEKQKRVSEIMSKYGAPIFVDPESPLSPSAVFVSEQVGQVNTVSVTANATELDGEREKQKALENILAEKEVKILELKQELALSERLKGCVEQLLEEREGSLVEAQLQLEENQRELVQVKKRLDAEALVEALRQEKLEKEAELQQKVAEAQRLTRLVDELRTRGQEGRSGTEITCETTGERRDSLLSKMGHLFIDNQIRVAQSIASRLDESAQILSFIFASVIVLWVALFCWVGLYVYIGVMQESTHYIPPS